MVSQKNMQLIVLGAGSLISLFTIRNLVKRSKQANIAPIVDETLEGSGLELSPKMKQWVGLVYKYTEVATTPNKYIEDYNRISWAQAMAVIHAESSGDRFAVGKSSEVGLMQLKNIAVKDVGGTFASWEPEENIKQGISYLNKCSKKMSIDGESIAPISETFRAYSAGWPTALQNPSAGTERAKKKNEHLEFYRQIANRTDILKRLGDVYLPQASAQTQSEAGEGFQFRYLLPSYWF